MATELISRSQAKENGLRQYFTGGPCKHGHIAKRNVANGVCLECARDIEARYRDSNREKFREKWRRSEKRRNPIESNERKKRWASANQEKVAAKVKRWKNANRDRVREHQKKYRDANPDKISIKNKSYKTKHAERLKPINLARALKWAKDNPDKKRIQIQLRRSRKRGAEGTHTFEQLSELLAKQDFKCIGCDALLAENRTVDHIIPLSKGGSNWITNIQWLCGSCNSCKHDRTQDEFLRDKGKI